MNKEFWFSGKGCVRIPVIFSAGILVFSFLALSATQKDYSECIKKYNSVWGEPCVQCTEFRNSYRVSLRNTCAETLDVKCAVRENDNRWRTFIKLDLFPKDTMTAYACNGTGKYMVWAKRAGDKMNEFPTDNEINAQFGK